MRLTDYPGNWGPTLDHMLQNIDGFPASSWERAAEVAKSVGDTCFADFLLEIAARQAARHLEVWGHCG